MTRLVKASIALVLVYLVIWAGVLGLPFTNLPVDKVDSWVSNLIVVEEVLSLVCIVLIGKIILTDVKASLTKPS